MAIAGTLTYKTDIDQTGIKTGMAKTGSIVKGVIAGLGITKLISSAMSTIKNSTDDAIERLDTLNNFPKVMSNLGISAEKSSKSIKKMSDKLAGLPTTLNQGASAVQRFTSKNGDVEKSTDIFLALNNAILAGGASTETQASALEQLSQAYAKGKPDMMEWRSAMTAMPAQLNQVAEAMGYGKNGADELGEALRKGDVSMDEFMDTIVKLNTEGVDGLKSFEDQARNSVAGIRTSITVAKTQIVKGVADIITALDIKLDKLGLGSLSEIIRNIGIESKKSLDFVAELISGDTEKTLKYLANKLKTKGPDLIKKLGEGMKNGVKKIIPIMAEIFRNILEIIKENLPAIIEAGSDIISSLAEGISKEIPTLIPLAVDTITTYYNAIIENAPKILEAGMTLVLALVQGIIDALPKLLEQAPKLISAGADLVVFLADGIISAIPKLIAEVPHIIAQLVLALTDPAMILKLKSVGPRIMLSLAKALIENIPNMLLAVPRLITELYVGFRDKITKTNWADLGKNIVKGIWEGIKSMAGWFKDKLTGWVGDVTSFLKKTFKIKSPSRLMADEVGQWLPKGIAIGIDANTDSVIDSLDDMYQQMNQAIQVESSKLNLNTISGDVYNRTFYQTPVQIGLEANVEMEGQKVGRLVTPSVVKTIKTGGGTL